MDGLEQLWTKFYRKKKENKTIACTVFKVLQKMQ